MVEIKTGCEFIWVFGTSAVGKYTLINKLNSSEALKCKLGLSGDVMICKESLELVGDKCPNNETRKILSKVLEKMQKYDKPILIKGQSVDLYTNKIPQMLLKLYPDASHKIIFLWVEPKELRNRWSKRGRENPASAEGAQNEQLSAIKNLESGFKVFYLNSTDETYKDFNSVS